MSFEIVAHIQLSLSLKFLEKKQFDQLKMFISLAMQDIIPTHNIF